MKAEILCLYDEGAMVDTNLIGAKGLSISIDINGDRTVFDAGLRGRYLLDNMEQLDYDPKSVSRFVISHNHASNIKGLDGYLRSREDRVKVYSNSMFTNTKGFFGTSIFKKDSSVKIDYECVSSDLKINDYITIIGPFGPLEELFLVLNARNGPVLFGSCFHCGLEQVFEHVVKMTGKAPVCLIGGIHLPKVKEIDVKPIADILLKYGKPNLYLDHCAGPAGVMYLRKHFTIDGVKEFIVGTKLNFDL